MKVHGQNIYTNNIDTVGKLFNCEGHSQRQRPMQVDIVEAATEFIIKADMPGLEKSQFSILVKNDRLIVGATLPLEKTERKYLLKERYNGAYQRIFNLPPHADLDNIKAEAENGVLQIIIPKVKQTPHLKIPIT